MVDNIKFLYCNRSANILADKIAKRADLYSKFDLIYICSFPCVKKDKIYTNQC